MCRDRMQRAARPRVDLSESSCAPLISIHQLEFHVNGIWSTNKVGGHLGKGTKSPRTDLCPKRTQSNPGFNWTPTRKQNKNNKQTYDESVKWDTNWIQNLGLYHIFFLIRFFPAGSTVLHMCDDLPMLNSDVVPESVSTVTDFPIQNDEVAHLYWDSLQSLA